MNKFLERLNTGETLVADGATGSNLQKMGLKPGRPPEDLIIDSPDGGKLDVTADLPEHFAASMEQIGFDEKASDATPMRDDPPPKSREEKKQQARQHAKNYR